MATDNGHLESFGVSEMGEYARVFLHYGSSDGHDGRARLWGTLSVYSSFGSYGHFWSHMGKPLPDFLAGIDGDYLLGKISRQETCGKRLLASIRRELIALRRGRKITKDEAREAWTGIEDAESEHGGAGPQASAVLAHELYCADYMPQAFDYCDVNSSDFPVEARQFVAKLWPAIVAKLKELSAVTT